MRRFRAIAFAVVVVAAAAPAQSQARLTDVLGTVTNAARPVADALIIALNLQNLEATEARSSSDGSFSLPALRAGIYKIIAVKQGFLPVITTLVPSRSSHKVALRLESDRGTNRKTANQELWELRGSLPPDVLRDLDFATRPVEAAYEAPRFRGEMLSLTGVTNTPANPAYAQTELGVQGRFGESWQVGIRGNLQRFEDPTDEVSFGAPVAESSVMSMEIHSSATQSYKVASTMSRILYAEPRNGEQEADVQAHNFEWQRGPAHVQVRYFAQDNLFRDSPVGSNLIEIAGNVPVLQSPRNDLNIGVRVTQESVAQGMTSSPQTLRVADLSASGTFAVVPALILHYGMAGQVGLEGQEWAPRAGAEWKVTESSSLIGSVMVKALDRDASTVILPSLVFWSEESRVLPRYGYTIGVVSGKDGKNHFSAIATVTAVDEPLRVVFADDQNQFWDGLYVDSGDIRRDLRVAYSRQFGKNFAIDIATSAGTATPSLQDHVKVYVTGDLQSTFNPTRTTLAVSYRDIQQPGDEGDDYRSERLHVRMAQSLYLPVDIKLLLGLEVARAENSPYLIETLNAAGRSRKYIGGLALNF